jgi:diguanylate cyclase (GGDEF)-like protein
MLDKGKGPGTRSLPGRWLVEAAFVVSAVLAAGLVALEYDLLANGAGRDGESNRIETAEALLLGTFLVIGLLAFSARRFAEQKREFSRRLAAEARAREALGLALLDPLTGLANRRHFDEIFGAAAGRSQEEDRHALLLLDLNDFKAVNDRHGHADGDQVLRIASDRLRKGVKEGDLAFRLGGDEFAVVAFGVGGEAGVAELAERLRRAVALPMAVDGRIHHVTASVGHAFFPSDGTPATEIFVRADAALYVAKAGKGVARVGSDDAGDAMRKAG